MCVLSHLWTWNLAKTSNLLIISPFSFYVAQKSKSNAVIDLFCKVFWCVCSSRTLNDNQTACIRRGFERGRCKFCLTRVGTLSRRALKAKLCRVGHNTNSISERLTVKLTHLCKKWTLKLCKIMWKLTTQACNWFNKCCRVYIDLKTIKWIFLVGIKRKMC